MLLKLRLLFSWPTSGADRVEMLQLYECLRRVVYVCGIAFLAAEKAIFRHALKQAE